MCEINKLVNNGNVKENTAYMYKKLLAGTAIGFIKPESKQHAMQMAINWAAWVSSSPCNDF